MLLNHWSRLQSQEFFHYSTLRDQLACTFINTWFLVEFCRLCHGLKKMQCAWASFIKRGEHNDATWTQLNCIRFPSRSWENIRDDFHNHVYWWSNFTFVIELICLEWQNWSLMQSLNLGAVNCQSAGFLYKACSGLRELSLNLPWAADQLSIGRPHCGPHYDTKLKKTYMPFCKVLYQAEEIS